jgi:RNA polymerase sigma factor (sigma-70 family)
MTISKERYNHWRKIALSLTANSFEADDLLHDTIGRILENNLDHIKDIEAYVAHAIRIAYYSNRSSYHNLYRKHLDLYADITDEHLQNMAVESVWMADRLTNEQLDIYISRLPFFEREVFYLYALNDFSYDELSRETGIPKSYLYQTVKAAKDELRKSIIRL